MALSTFQLLVSPYLNHKIKFMVIVVLGMMYHDGHTQNDTLWLRGKVENLSLRLYRRAPEVVVSRTNILRPNRVIIKVAPLQSDGSFELKIPLVYPIEECNLSYANMSVPFLATKGKSNVKINGDSLDKANLPLLFEGVLANINNQHTRFWAAFNKWLITNPEKKESTDNINRFWETLTTERERRTAYFSSFFSQPEPLLSQWVLSSFSDIMVARFYDQLLQTDAPFPTSFTSLVALDTTQILTFSKANSYDKFIQHTVNTTPTPKESTLPVKLLSTLILENIPNLSEEEKERLFSFTENGVAKMRDINFLNTLFERRKDIMQPLSIFETYLKKYASAISTKELDYIQANFYARYINSAMPQTMELWYHHIRPKISNQLYKISLDELHHNENLDSTLINKTYRQLSENAQVNINEALEPISGVYLHQNAVADGNAVWEKIKRHYRGTPFYVIFWTNDDLGLQSLEEARLLRNLYSEKELPFVYLCEQDSGEDLWVQSVIKNKNRGLHIKLTEEQNDFFVNSWGITRVPHSVLVDATGKYISRDAPLPSDQKGWEKIHNKIWR
ncbi:hypothetical protein P1X15_14620 [Runella sp. MFBS21]|uniref:TlpA family protein disulfide reductase n=1 Tax=Runella sp. MFBS21 TaxID=3034018 RepID=UPI0023F7A94F|nr:hypothetical protein [Runella sp. MFBS21]MDF7818846.1 hypothetical protein [Runella sp. MFBS21]